MTSVMEAARRHQTEGGMTARQAVLFELRLRVAEDEMGAAITDGRLDCDDSEAVDAWVEARTTEIADAVCRPSRPAVAAGV